MKNVYSILRSAGASILIASPQTAGAAEPVQQQVQSIIECTYETELQFSANDPRKKAFSTFETCSVPLTIRATNHPNIVEFVSSWSGQFFLYPLQNPDTATFLGDTFADALKEVQKYRR